MALRASAAEMPQHESAVSVCGHAPPRRLVDDRYISMLAVGPEKFVVQVRETLQRRVIVT
jgi:hypothetical protein